MWEEAEGEEVGEEEVLRDFVFFFFCYYLTGTQVIRQRNAAFQQNTRASRSVVHLFNRFRTLTIGTFFFFTTQSNYLQYHKTDTSHAKKKKKDR